MDINILCVCTGNICRSPLAERLLARALPTKQVASAGIGAVEGAPMAPAAAAIAARESLLPLAHAGRQITADMTRRSELILVMEQQQKEWMENRYRKSAERVYMLTHWQGGDDIMDPFLQSTALFESVYEELVACVEDWVLRLSA